VRPEVFAWPKCYIMSYKEDLLSPQWQRKRLEIMQRDGFKCCLCGTDKNSLSVHHLYYEAKKKPQDYDDESMITLCQNCHEIAHGSVAKISSLIAFSILKKRKTFIEVDECLKNGGLI